MKRFFHLFIFIIGIACLSCNAGRVAFNPDKRFPPQKLKQDYGLFRNILEESHPGLYWYTTKDSLDYYFDRGFQQIRDSMTETQFRILLSYVITKINCGHTSVRGSKQYARWMDTARLKLFPLTLKLWDDTMVVTYNIDRKDSILKKGTVLTSINGLTQPQLRDSLFNFQVTDGYSMSGKYQSLSTGFNFGVWYNYIFGQQQKLNIHYIDSSGNDKETTIPLYDARADSLSHIRGFLTKRMRGSRKERKYLFLYAARNIQMDTLSGTAFMTINTFSHGNHLKSFFRRSFKLLDEKKIRHLVIDVRSNGGGEASNSTLLTRYLKNQKFKLADSLYAVNRYSHYGKYIEKNFLYRVMMNFVTKKNSDGKYHFGYFERHYFYPKTHHHFDGPVYILIGGNSFSATTLFAGCLKGQKNITLVGEETGGGYYGNSAWVIPDVILPNTKIRFRLPKFRLVIDKNREKNGRGVMPDVWALPSTEAIRKGLDFKAGKTRELINLRDDPKK